jgi:hypothetical protein
VLYNDGEPYRRNGECKCSTVVAHYHASIVHLLLSDGIGADSIASNSVCVKMFIHLISIYAYLSYCPSHTQEKLQQQPCARCQASKLHRLHLMAVGRLMKPTVSSGCAIVTSLEMFFTAPEPQRSSVGQPVLENLNAHILSTGMGCAI